ncbi:MAG: transporter substrate-binding domain-containing protein [Chitinophagaceae bacterium]|nr:MAG: transporter substrate-binding domain-containing protein [Chitinophagaceae bacterium]
MFKPKPYHFFIPLLLLSLVARAQLSAVHTDSWAHTKKTGKGNIAVLWYAIEPFIYFNEGEIVGIEYELMQGFAPFLKKRYGTNVNLQWIDAGAFEPIYPAIRQSKEKGLFAVSYYSITDQRKKEVKFAPPYMPDLNILVTSNNLPVYNSPEEFYAGLPKLSGYTMAQTTMEEDMNYFRRQSPALKISNRLDDYEVINEVAAVNNAFGYVPLSIYVLALQRGTKVKRQKILATRREGLAAIYSKNSDWDEPVNAYFNSEECKQLTASLIRKHLGVEVADIILEVSAPDSSRRPTADIELLTKEREIVTKRLIDTALQYQRSQAVRNITIIAVLIFIIISLVLFKMLTSKKKLANLLAQRNQEIISQKQEIEKINRRLQQKLAVSQLNPHLIFNSLTAIQHFVMLDDKKMANKYLSQLGKFIRYILQNSSEPLISSVEEKNMLEQYLNLEQARFNNSFEYRLEVEGNGGQIPSMLTFPFVEEALYERVLAGDGSDGQKLLSVSFTEKEGVTAISIKDNSLAQKKMESGKAVRLAEEQIAAINKGQLQKIHINRKCASGHSQVDIIIPNTVLL